MSSIARGQLTDKGTGSSNRYRGWVGVAGQGDKTLEGNRAISQRNSTQASTEDSNTLED